MIQLESKALVGDQAAEFDVLDQGRKADGVKAMAGQQDEPYQVPKRVGQREDLVVQPPFDLSMASFGSPFCALRVAVNFDDCRVDHGELHIWIVRYGIKIHLKTPAFTQSR